VFAHPGCWKASLAALLASVFAVLLPLRDSKASMPRMDGNILLSGGNWKLQNASLVHALPITISEASFDDRQWIPTIVPGTVLGSCLAIGAFPDPWFGDQMSRIPDDLFSTNNFWYRCSFILPAKNAGHGDTIRHGPDYRLRGQPDSSRCTDDSP